MLLLDYGRELGLRLGGIYKGRNYGWTLDSALAETMRGAGATVITGYGVDADNPGQPGGNYPKSASTPMGWEISFPIGTEL